MQEPAETKDCEAQFDLHELFFSTTDARGIIGFGNDVFVRASGYSPQELTGRPHNIIRHPDMPRVVFGVLWEYLHAGKSIVAYVKNKAKNGSFYWVCALIAPIAGGYLSVRLKPSSKFLAPVAALYKELREAECSVESAGGTGKQAMEVSRPKLEAAVHALGYTDYDAFMNEMFLAEVMGRKTTLAASQRAVPAAHQATASAGFLQALRQHAATLAHQVDGLFMQLGAFLSLEQALAGKADYIKTLGSNVRFLAMNAEIHAAGMGDEGRTLQVVAQQMSRGATEIVASTNDVSLAMSKVTQVLRAAAFQIAASDLSMEMMSAFLRELAQREDAASAAEEIKGRIAKLAETVSNNLAHACQMAAETAGQIQKLDERVEDFLKQIRTLEIVHVTGRVEAAFCADGVKIARFFHEIYGVTQVAREKFAEMTEVIDRARIQLPADGVVQESLGVLSGCEA